MFTLVAAVQRASVPVGGDDARAAYAVEGVRSEYLAGGIFSPTVAASAPLISTGQAANVTRAPGINGGTVVTRV